MRLGLEHPFGALQDTPSDRMPFGHLELWHPSPYWPWASIRTGWLVKKECIRTQYNIYIHAIHLLLSYKTNLGFRLYCSSITYALSNFFSSDKGAEKFNGENMSSYLDLGAGLNSYGPALVPQTWEWVHCQKKILVYSNLASQLEH